MTGGIIKIYWYDRWNYILECQVELYIGMTGEIKNCYDRWNYILV